MRRKVGVVGCVVSGPGIICQKVGNYEDYTKRYSYMQRAHNEPAIAHGTYLHAMNKSVCL